MSQQTGTQKTENHQQQPTEEHVTENQETQQTTKPIEQEEHVSKHTQQETLNQIENTTTSEKTAEEVIHQPEQTKEAEKKVHKSSSEAQELRIDDNKSPEKEPDKTEVVNIEESQAVEEPPTFVVEDSPAKPKEVQVHVEQIKPILEPVPIAPIPPQITPPITIQQTKLQQTPEVVPSVDTQNPIVAQSVPTDIIVPTNQVQHSESMQPPTQATRKLSHSMSMGMNAFAVQVKHINKQEQDSKSSEPAAPVENKQNEGNNAVPSSDQSEPGDISELNKQIVEEQFNQFAEGHLGMFSPEKKDDSNESQADEAEDKARLQEVMRLAEESKARLTKELEMSEKLKKEMDDEIPFSKKLFSSTIAATVVGGAAMAFTKNKRTTVIASLATLALSFIIQ